MAKVFYYFIVAHCVLNVLWILSPIPDPLTILLCFFCGAVIYAIVLRCILPRLVRRRVLAGYGLLVFMAVGVLVAQHICVRIMVPDAGSFVSQMESQQGSISRPEGSLSYVVLSQDGQRIVTVISDESCIDVRWTCRKKGEFEADLSGKEYLLVAGLYVLRDNGFHPLNILKEDRDRIANGLAKHTLTKSDYTILADLMNTPMAPQPEY